MLGLVVHVRILILNSDLQYYTFEANAPYGSNGAHTLTSVATKVSMTPLPHAADLLAIM